MKRAPGSVFLLLATLIFAGSVSAQTQRQPVAPPSEPADAQVSGEIAIDPQMHEAVTPAGAQLQPQAQRSAEPAAPVAPGAGAMSIGGKFQYAVVRGLGPRAVGSAALMGAYSQARNTDSGFGQGGEGYGKRVASKYGTYATRQLIGSFVLASVFRQDPRFYRSRRTGFFSRLNYAVSREFIARSDSGGAQFNISRVGGAVAAAFIAGQWRPGYTRGDAAEDAGLLIATDILQNAIAEFWPDIRKRLGH